MPIIERHGERYLVLAEPIVHDVDEEPSGYVAFASLEELHPGEPVNIVQVPGADHPTQHDALAAAAEFIQNQVSAPSVL